MNPRAKTCRQEECDEREFSVKFKIPALGVAVFLLHTSQRKERQQRLLSKKQQSESCCQRNLEFLLQRKMRRQTAKKEGCPENSSEEISSQESGLTTERICLEFHNFS